MARFLIVFCTFLAVTGLSTAEPVEKEEKKPKKENRLEDIKSDQMKFSIDEKTGRTVIILEGRLRIVATQFRLRADYGEGHQNKEGKFVLAFSKGNVRIFIEGTMLQSDRLDYDYGLQMLYLTPSEDRPNPRAYREGRIISAQKILYDLKAKDESKKIIFKGDARMKEGSMPAEYYEEFPKKEVEKKEEGNR